MGLLHSKPSDDKSSSSETKQTLNKRLKGQKQKTQRLARLVNQQKAEIKKLQRSIAEQEERELELQEQIKKYQEVANGASLQNAQELNRVPIRRHQFSAKMIALAVNVALETGFRASERVLEIVFDSLDLDIKVPSHDSILRWTSRIGVGELEDTFAKDQNVIWFADHSCQIGKEKILVILGIDLNDLPEPGKTLSLDEVKVLAIVPGTQWTKEDVGREYLKLAEQIGAPRYLLCDGATELREPAELLEKDGQKTIVIGDLKHVAANILEKEIGRTERFKEFLSEVNLTRHRIQQTELSHFTPPTLKQKSRFMNIGPLLNWATMLLYHLSHPHSESRKGITPKRMNEKLGWLRKYRDDLACWSACQDAIHLALKFINHQGITKGATKTLRSLFAEELSDRLDVHQPARRVTDLLIAHIKSSEEKLRPGDRIWGSTEILESLFGRFKQVEGQHSKSGFTGLITVIPTLCRTITPELARQRLLDVTVKKQKNWIQTNLGQTLMARRTKAYQEHKKAVQNQTAA